MAAPARLDYTNANLLSITLDAFSRDLRDVPLSTMVGHGKCIDYSHSWRMRNEQAANSGLVAEDAAFSDPTARDYTSVSNTCQIIRKSFSMTETMSAIATVHGRDQLSIEMDQAEIDWTKSFERGLLLNTEVTTGTRQQAALLD